MEDIAEFGKVIDRAFYKKGFSGSGPAVARSMDSLDDVRLAILQDEEGEKIVGACPIKAYPFHFGPNNMKSGGLSVVGVDPDFQRKGIGQMLLKDAEEYMLQEGYDVCLLKTGSPDFYRHNGWEMGVDTYLYEAQTSKVLANLNEDKNVQDQPYHFSISPFAVSDIPIISQIYENYQQNRAMTRIRDNKYWEKRFQDHPNSFDGYYGIKYDNQLLGYFWLVRRYPDTEGGLMSSKKKRIGVVDYAVDLKQDAGLVEEIYRFIIAQIVNFAKIEDFPFIHLELPDTYELVTRFLQLGAQDISYWWSAVMVLIVNIKTFLEKLKAFQEDIIFPILDKEKLRKLGDQEFVLECLDHQIQYHISEGHIEIRLNPPQISTIAIPISRKNLGVMVLANFTPEDLVDSEYWECPESSMELLQIVFPKLKTYITFGDGF